MGYLDGGRQDFVDDFNLSYDLGKSKFNLYEVSGPLTVDGGRYCSHHVDNKSIIPSINPLEDIDSCNELSIGQKKEQITLHQKENSRVTIR